MAEEQHLDEVDLIVHPWLITILWDEDEDIMRLDIGDLTPFEARTVLQDAQDALSMISPVVVIQSNGDVILDEQEDEDEEED